MVTEKVLKKGPMIIIIKRNLSAKTIAERMEKNNNKSLDQKFIQSKVFTQ